MKKIILLVLSLGLLSACQKQPIVVANPTVAPSPTSVAVVPTANPMCDWIDKSDVIIKVKIPEGMTPDTSYETGFVYSKPDKPSLELKLARVARSQCEYRVGFNKSDFKNIANATIAVWTYTGTVRQKISGDPIKVDFVNNLPSFGKNLDIELSP
jgi:hypothetical protein